LPLVPIMAIELYFSNRLEELADRFSAILESETRADEDLFQGGLTIVPNPNLIKWLQLFLAKKWSIYMHLDFEYLEAGLWRLLARLDPRQEKPEMIDKPFVQMVLLDELQRLGTDDNEFAPLRRYLWGMDGKRGADYDVKLWQLSDKLAHLFQEYQFHRSEMIQKWLSESTRAVGMELCQKKLYLQMRETRSKYAEITGNRLLFMGEYADEVLEGPHVDLTKASIKRSVHFFGLSQVSAFHLMLIGRLKDYYNIYIYALNPCREFWEDITTPHEKRWIQRKEFKKLEIRQEEKKRGELSGVVDNDPLSLWGKPGRESIRLLSQLTEYDFHSCYTGEAEAKTLLRKLQNHILTLSQALDAEERSPQDRSLQILACPGLYREVETVYNSILYNLETDRKLQLTDIAILVPDISKYKPVLDYVFHREPGKLSYNMIDSRADVESIYGQAILKILELATGRLSRKEVFDLLLNPCFMHKWRIGPEQLQVWADWAESLNIFYAFDPASKSSKGYQPNAYYTWKQGLQRLRLSRILAGADQEDQDQARDFHGLLPFSDVNTGDVDLLEGFSVIIERLYWALKGLDCMRGTGGEWRQVLLKICDDLLGIPPDLKGENAVRLALMEAFENLSVYDRIRKCRPVKEREAPLLKIGLVREFVKSSLSSISGGYGDYLTGGVTISALMPMRPISFRIVYVLGMEEGGFPGREDASSLDLRLLKRQVGDISEPERNRYLFLELLLSVKHKFYISYISKDLQKDRTLQLCSVVSQMLRYVEQEILSKDQTFRITEIPLKGSSEKYLSTHPEDQATDVFINYSLSDRISFYRESGLWPQVCRLASGEEIGLVERFFPEFSLGPEKPETDDPLVERITLAHLKKFLEDPVSHAISRRLGIYDEDETIEEIALREDEPFYSEFPVDYALSVVPLKKWLDFSISAECRTPDKRHLEQIFDHVYEVFRQNSMTPEGAFAELDKGRMRDQVLRKGDLISPVLEIMKASQEIYRSVFIGDLSYENIPSINTLPIKRFDPVMFTVKTWNTKEEEVELKVELHGQLPWLCKDRSGNWQALVLTGSQKRQKVREPDRYILAPLLFYMFCLCGEESLQWMRGGGVTFHVVYGEEIKSWAYVLTHKKAVTYLDYLVSEYITKQKFEWLPFDLVTSRSIKPHKLSEEKINEIMKRAFYAQLMDSYSEVESHSDRLVRPAIPEDAFDKVRERFKIFFETID
jgi:exodeoxyribonuclease V gamma subunit